MNETRLNQANFSAIVSAADTIERRRGMSKRHKIAYVTAQRCLHLPALNLDIQISKHLNKRVCTSKQVISQQVKSIIVKQAHDREAKIATATNLEHR